MLRFVDMHLENSCQQCSVLFQSRSVAARRAEFYEDWDLARFLEWSEREREQVYCACRPWSHTKQGGKEDVSPLFSVIIQVEAGQAFNQRIKCPYSWKAWISFWALAPEHQLPANAYSGRQQGVVQVIRSLLFTWETCVGFSALLWLGLC